MVAMPDYRVHLNEIPILVPPDPAGRIGRHDPVKKVTGGRRAQAQQIALIANTTQHLAQMAFPISPVQVAGQHGKVIQYLFEIDPQDYIFLLIQNKSSTMSPCHS